MYKIHKGSWGIGQAKGHRCEFVATKPCLKWGFEDVFRFNPKLMVSRHEINLRKDSCSLQLIKQIIYSGQRVFVVDGDFF